MSSRLSSLIASHRRGDDPDAQLMTCSSRYRARLPCHAFPIMIDPPATRRVSCLIVAVTQGHGIVRRKCPVQWRGCLVLGSSCHARSC
jgi:hypothetical protein